MSDLFKDTLRATIVMIVPVVAFLGILSAVILFAAPHPQTETRPASPTIEAVEPQTQPSLPNTRAAVRPNKI